MMQSMNALEQTKFDKQGLIPAIAQDYQTGDILMFAWMNKESLALTIEKQQAVYYSRSTHVNTEGMPLPFGCLSFVRSRNFGSRFKYLSAFQKPPLTEKTTARQFCNSV